jgi:alcohol dehydrogenase, propanol-preferring
MTTMRAYRMLAWGQPAAYREVAVPVPGPGQVLIRMAGAGLCGSDLHILHSPPGFWPKEPPFTLGHENAGWVAATGAGVTSVSEGDGVIVSGVGFCGTCDRCVGGMQNECRTLVMAGYGSGDDGGLAEFMVADVRHVVGLGRLDPAVAAPLADAGATSYHAVKRQQARLRPGSTAVVIGVGGLGSYAVQYLALLTGAQVIAVDTVAHRLDNARRLGADQTVLSDTALVSDNTVAALRAAAGGPADVVFDFVGTAGTLRTAIAAIGSGGRIVIAGIGGGEVSVGWHSMPMNAHVINTMGFTPADLIEVVELAASGAVEVAATHFAFDDIASGIAALRDATVEGRAVVTFG